MRLSFRLGLIALCLLAPSIASADDSSWYMGAGVGQTQASAPAPLYTEGSYFRSGNDVTYYSNSSNRRSTAIQLDAGYWYSPDFAVQAAYMDLGQYTRFARGSSFFECQTCFYNTPFIESVRLKVGGLSLSVVPRLYSSGDFEVLGRVGLFWNRVTYKEDTNGNVFSTFVINGVGYTPGAYPARHTGIDPTLGVSLGWKPMAHWEVLLSADEYFDVGSSIASYGTFSVAVISLGLQYHF